MGNENSKINFRRSFIQLLKKTQPVDINDEVFWNQFWCEYDTNLQDVFILIPSSEIRVLREESPNNMGTLCYKAVEKLTQLSETFSLNSKKREIVLNCIRILTRLLPFLFEDNDWRSFFWSSLPSQPDPSGEQVENSPLASAFLSSLLDFLFFPDFTVSCPKKTFEETGDENSGNKVIDSCEFIWQSGVGFTVTPHHSPAFDRNRAEILKLILTCFSETMYIESFDLDVPYENLWIKFCTGTENRHALPLFTSLLNTVFAYDPVGYGVPYNHLMFSDTQEPLMEVALQILCVTLETNDDFNLKISKKKDDMYKSFTTSSFVSNHANSINSENDILKDMQSSGNLFINYMSRIHRDEDFSFILNGFIRLLNNPLGQTYFPGSTKKVRCHQELLILLWRMCDINRRFLFFLLKSSDILDIFVPILFHLNGSRLDQSRIGLVHLGVFILLLFSGERNFGVRLNKPYDNRVSMDIPVFTGTHADLLIIVFHKVITTGHHMLQPLFDCLLTVIVNVSPYLKSLSMVTASKLVHLLEAFTTPWFLFSNPSNHHLVFFLLEILNNIVQYQFDGNSNLVYSIIRKRTVFYHLVNLKTDQEYILETMAHRNKSSGTKTKQILTQNEDNIEDNAVSSQNDISPCTLQASLKETPTISNITSKYQRSVTDDDHSEDDDSTDHSKKLTPSESDNAKNDEIKSSTHKKSDNLSNDWVPTTKWLTSWKQKLPLQTIMRLLQVLVPQVEKLCIEKGLTDESEILSFLQKGTLVGLLPVPHPILIRKYQANVGTNIWFKTYMWGVIYLRNIDPAIWHDTNVRLFEIQKVSDN